MITTLTVGKIVEKFENGEIAIPEIQRDVVWDATQVKSLLDSIIRGYPCGSIILWEPRERDKGLVKAIIRPERLQNFENKVPRYFLLDGQQRISSLASMLLSRGILKKVLFELEEDMPYLYVNIKNPDRDIEATTEKTSYKSPWFLINNLLDNSYQTNDDYLKFPVETKKRVSDFVTKVITYEFPTQIISEVSYPEVGEIFSRINSQGTQLTGAEIYLARIVPHWQGITKEFREFRRNIHTDYSYEIDINFLMKLITAIECNVPQIKKLADRVVNKTITTNQLNKTWGAAKKSIETIVKILHKDLSLDKSKYFVSKNSLVPLTYYANKLNGKSISKKKVSKFFLLSQLSEHYGSSSESVLKNDLRIISNEPNLNQGLSELLKDVERETRQLYRVRNLRIKPENVEGVASKNVLLLFMYIAMQRRKATDFGLTKPDRLSNIPSDKMQLHHIFPANFMMEPTAAKKYQENLDMNSYDYRRLINDISNLTFLSQEKNASIGDTSPLQYFENETTKEMRKAHFIPEDKELWNPDNFYKFLEARQQLIAADINKILNSIK